MDGGEGAALFDVWQDTVLRFSCAFAVATDGRVRCLPVDEDLPIITSMFADAACSRAIALGPPPDQPYVRIADPRCGRSGDDDHPMRVVRWGSVVQVDVPYSLRSGVCAPITNGPNLVWNAIAEAPPVQFVAASEQVHRGPDGVAVRVLVGEDGSRENARLVDPGTSRPCEVLSDHVLGGPNLCVPTPFAASPALPFYADGACGAPIAFAEPGCDHAFAGVMLGRKDCKLGVDLVELGGSFATESASIFRLYADGVCRAQMLSEPLTAYLAGPPLSVGAFVAPTTRSLGTGRLEARLHATSDGVMVKNQPQLPLRYELDPDSTVPVLQPAGFEFYDRVLATECRVERVADDSLRCVPTSTVPKFGEYFEDEACTIPAHLGINDPGCGLDGYVSVPGWLEVGLGLHPTAEIRSIGAPLDKPMFMYAPFPVDPSQPPRGTCVPAPSDPGRVYYALGKPIPVADLALVTSMTE
jgi:hypothetical protein